jgi:hypothetical protein
MTVVMGDVVELRDALPDAPLEKMQEGLQRGKAS